MGLLLLLLVGCGPSPPRQKIGLATLTVYVNQGDPVPLVPLRVAEDLGFFHANRLRVAIVHQRAQAAVRIEPIGMSWPTVGYLTIRPDLLLLSSTPDPQFRLSALNHLPLPASINLTPQKPLVEKILAAHHAVLSHWSMLSNPTIQALWRRHHLPWVLVPLSEAAKLYILDPHTVILAWLGASTGPVPSWVVASPHASQTQVAHFLAGLDLALWYLHTTPARHIAQVLHNSQHPINAWMLKTALHYHYWPVTVFPTASAYNRRKEVFNPDWPSYSGAVDPKPASQVLGTLAPEERS